MKKMPNKLAKYIVFIGMWCIAIMANAQPSDQSISQSMDQHAAQWLQGSYRYNAVIAVLVIIFLGIWIFLFRINNKLNRMERNSTK